MSEYTPIYTKPYPDGWINAPPEETPVTAEIMDAYDDAIENIENYLSENPIESSGGSDADLIDLVVENSISLGRKTDTTIGQMSVAEGKNTTASGNYSHAENDSTTASGTASHAEGSETTASGNYSHAEGLQSKAQSMASHAEGNGTTASGTGSHAEGQKTKANKQNSHAEGYYSTAGGNNSHAEGANTTAGGEASHAEGSSTTANGYASHAEGRLADANGYASHSEGLGTKASTDYQHVQGKYNVEDTSGTYAHIVGGGSSDTDRKNIHTLDWQGNAEYAGTVKSAGLRLTDAVTGQEYMLTMADGSLEITPA